MASLKVVKLGPILKELRIHLCQKSPESKGIRDFIKKYYVSLKMNNPTFPILIRESGGVQPKMFARYAFGRETGVALKNYSGEQIMKTIEQLANDK